VVVRRVEEGRREDPGVPVRRDGRQPPGAQTARRGGAGPVSPLLTAEGSPTASQA
jgi:hypothetical protein